MAARSCFFISLQKVVARISSVRVALKMCTASLIWNCHIGWDVGVVAKMDGQLECNASCHHVFGNGYDEAKMAMTTAATS